MSSELRMMWPVRFPAPSKDGTELITHKPGILLPPFLARYQNLIGDMMRGVVTSNLCFVEIEEKTVKAGAKVPSRPRYIPMRCKGLTLTEIERMVGLVLMASNTVTHKVHIGEFNGFPSSDGDISGAFPYGMHCVEMEGGRCWAGNNHMLLEPTVVKNDTTVISARITISGMVLKDIFGPRQVTI